MRRSTLVIFSFMLGCTPAFAQYEEDRAKPCNAACRAWMRSVPAFRQPAYVVFDDDDDDDDDGYDDAWMRPRPVGRLREGNGVWARKATGSAPTMPTRAAANRPKPTVAAKKSMQTQTTAASSRAAAKKREARTAEPKVGHLALFGSIAPTAQKPIVPKLVPRGPARKLAISRGPEPKPAVAKVAAPSKVFVADAPRSAESQTPATRDDADRRERVNAAAAQRKVPDPNVLKVQIPEVPKDAVDPHPAAAPHPLSVLPQEVAVAAPRASTESRSDRAVRSLIDPQQTPARQSDAEPVLKEAVTASAEEAATTAEPGNEVPIAEEDAVMPEPDLQVAALGSGVKALPTPPPITETPVKTMAAPTVTEVPVQVPVTLPQYQSPEPIPPAATDLKLPDWGDEKKLIETLRADWKSVPVARSFRVGEQVPSEILLKPLPPLLASRDQGVNMHYFMANADAVLVLPRLRVVVDVYHSPGASLPER